MPKPVWLFALCLIGCAAKNPYLGSWDSEVTIMGNRIPLFCTFGERGDYMASFEVGGVHGKLTGTYKFEKERLSIVIAKVDLDTKDSFLPQSMIKQGREEIEKQIKQPLEGKPTWIHDNSFTVKPEREGVPTLTFKKRPE